MGFHGQGAKEDIKGFENTALGETFGPQREEVTGGWSKLHNEALHDYIVRIIKVVKRKGNEMSRTCCMCGTEEKFVQICGRKS
jgi:hypothetical protein